MKPHRLGVLELVRKIPRLIDDRAGVFLEIAERHGDVVHVPVPGRPFYLVSAPEHVQHVLQSHADRYKKSFDIAIARDLLGRGLVTTENERWRANRTIVARAVRAMSMDAFADRTRAVAASVLAEHEARGTRVMTNQWFTSLTLSILAEVILGVPGPANPSALMDSFVTALRFIERRLSAIIDIDAFTRTRARRGFDDAVATMNVQLEAWVAQIRQRGIPSPEDGLAHGLVHAANTRTDGEESETWLIDELRNILFAGHETTALALTWLIAELAARPRVQDDLVSELDGGADSALIDSVVLETMRLHPPVWVLGRETIIDDDLDGAVIPAGSTVVLSPYVTQRLPRFWPDAAELIPSRFVGRRAPHPYAMFPFSGGPRRCLGERMALLEVRIVAEEILRRFVVRRTDARPLGRETLISLRPDQDFEIELVPRAG